MECDRLFKQIIHNYGHQLRYECRTIRTKLKYIFTNIINLRQLIQLIHRDYRRSKCIANKNPNQCRRYLQLANQLFYYRPSSYRKCLKYYHKALLECTDDTLKAQIYYSMAKLFTFQSNGNRINGQQQQQQQRLALQSINQAIKILENSSSLFNDELLSECRDFFNKLCRQHEIDLIAKNRNFHLGFRFEFDENCSIFYDNHKGRYLKSLSEAKNIPYGTHIIRERAISIILDSNHYHRYCFHCYRQLSTIIFIPCRQCRQIRFCSIKCEQKANTHQGIHRYECHLIAILQSNHYGWHLFRMIRLIGGYRNFIKWSIKQQRCHNDDNDNELSKKIVHRYDSIFNAGTNNSNQSYQEEKSSEHKPSKHKQQKPYYNHCLIEQMNQFRLKYEDDFDNDDQGIDKNNEKSKKGGPTNWYRQYNEQKHYDSTITTTEQDLDVDDEENETNSLNYYWKLLLQNFSTNNNNGSQNKTKRKHGPCC
nr:uncharacterized protein LOC124500369 [Dermatophagoides farinae]